MTGTGPTDLTADPRIRRILVIKWSAMGDVALATAAFEDVAIAFPAAEIHLSTLPPWDALFRSDPRFSEIVAIDVRAHRGRLGAMASWIRTVARNRYDLVIDLQTTDRSRFLLAALWLGGRQIPHRLGNKPAFPYNLAPPAGSGDPHALARMRAVLARAGIPARTARPVLHPDARARQRVADLFARHRLGGRRLAVLLPGSQAAGHLKRWGHRGYAALARELGARGVDRVLLVGGPDEVEECARIARLAGPIALDLCGQTELLEVAPVCERAEIVVANDTGTAHLAAAAARPMLVICGPTDPRRVRPAGPEVCTVQVDLPCINCYRKTCSHHACMRLITPHQVAGIVATLTADG